MASFFYQQSIIYRNCLMADIFTGLDGCEVDSQSSYRTILYQPKHVNELQTFNMNTSYMYHAGQDCRVRLLFLDLIAHMVLNHMFLHFQDLYVYLSSEEQIFTISSQKETLIWFLPYVELGDWTAGPEKDGTFTFHYQVKTTEVRTSNM